VHHLAASAAGGTRGETVGADEAEAALAAANAISAADTVPLDDGMVRQTLGHGEDDAEPETK
jgi:hypothetical protein